MTLYSFSFKIILPFHLGPAFSPASPLCKQNSSCHRSSQCCRAWHLSSATRGGTTSSQTSVSALRSQAFPYRVISGKKQQALCKGVFVPAKPEYPRQGFSRYSFSWSRELTLTILFKSRVWAAVQRTLLNIELLPELRA